MNEHGRILNTALEIERLHNARWINAFRLAGLVIALAIEVSFRLTRPGWIGAPIGLFVGWTVAAAALCLVGVGSPRIARAGSVAIVFVDMPLLYVVIAAIIDRLQAADLPLDAARLSAHAAMYYIGLLVL